ncbi:cation diffusion facilitator family transporter [Bradymonas sediminis]|uniref:Cation transporter n=1 Tax=Bradymonas sediminis TaxID=1548548 RepID=A0A2Z4FG94_9DELT|nr:cation diffusion facilitator family transporter [Bradymonas sediminis]AWV87953.1 cation transporter [Bradymonas sediminis]TDP62973.1 cobalt-zinc-cadmium efflux system protein [Bradymonas sediminis]
MGVGHSHEGAHSHDESHGHAHDHGHGHEHGHGHSHAPKATSENVRRLRWTLLLVLIYMTVEVVGGLLSNSLALLADAGHMLSDAASLALALFAMWIAQRPASPAQTFGYHRAEILAALANAVTLVGVSIYIVFEAVQRFYAPAEVHGNLMMGVAVGGLFVNLIGLWLLHSGKSDNLNMRGAWLHVLGDMLGSVGAIIAGLLIWGFGWHWADPVASIIIAVLVLWSAWHLLKATLSVLMEFSPPHIDVAKVQVALAKMPGVTGVHDLHIWTITSGKVALSVHIDVESLEGYAELMSEIRHHMDDAFGISHCTVQVEPPEFTHEPQCF